MGKRFNSAEERRRYNWQHGQVTKLRGSAKTHVCEELCGSQAAEWAQIHGKDGSDVQHFRPLCRPCHQKYDNRWNPEERAKLSATVKSLGIRPPSHLGVKRSEETKAKMSAAQKKRYAEEGSPHTGRKRSEETKERMRNAQLLRRARERGDAL